MRLIDADALKSFYGSWSDENTEFIKAEVDRFVDLQITIDAEPVRHGHWEYVKPEKGGVYGSCSICGYEAATTFHCPNCGAKMDNGG